MSIVYNSRANSQTVTSREVLQRVLSEIRQILESAAVPEHEEMSSAVSLPDPAYEIRINSLEKSFASLLQRVTEKLENTCRIEAVEKRCQMLESNQIALRARIEQLESRTDKLVLDFTAQQQSSGSEDSSAESEATANVLASLTRLVNTMRIAENEYQGARYSTGH